MFSGALSNFSTTPINPPIDIAINLTEVTIVVGVYHFQLLHSHSTTVNSIYSIFRLRDNNECPRKQNFDDIMERFSTWAGGSDFTLYLAKNFFLIKSHLLCISRTSSTKATCYCKRTLNFAITIIIIYNICYIIITIVFKREKKYAYNPGCKTL